jgi:hypothetical protein
MATVASPTQKALLAAVGAVLGSSLVLAGCSAFGSAEASPARPVSSLAPLGDKQGLLTPGLAPTAAPVDAVAPAVLPVDAGAPSGPALGDPSGPPQGDPSDPPQGDPSGPPQHEDPHHQPPKDPHHEPPKDPHHEPPTDPHAPMPGDPLYDPPIIVDPAPPHHDPYTPMPGDPLYDPPFEHQPDPIVRDHRGDAPGWGSPSGADAPGGVTVTPTDGGPVIRDHRK